MAETGAERGGRALTGRCLEEEEVDGDEKRKLAGRRMVDPGRHTSSTRRRPVVVGARTPYIFHRVGSSIQSTTTDTALRLDQVSSLIDPDRDTGVVSAGLASRKLRVITGRTRCNR